jgi:lycopene cyclase domain-containing protein
VYTKIDLIFFALSIIYDLFITKSKLLKTSNFWISYSILLPFQLLTNWWLTHDGVVQYNRKAIIGWRLASAPIEDIFFGFSLILFVLSTWMFLKRK